MSTLSFRKNGRSIGLVAGGLVAGAVLAGAFAASAADNAGSPSPSSSPSSSSSSSGASGASSGMKADRPANPNPGDESKPQRSDEALLTGDAAQSVKDAVLAKYPGATFVRVETDSDGVYEAHITKADGTATTVELDKNFAITGEEAGGPGGHGGPGGPGGHGGPGGQDGPGGHGGRGGMNDNDADDQPGAPAGAGSAGSGSTTAS